MNGRRDLVFPGGTEVGLEIWHSFKDCRNIELYSAESPISNHTISRRNVVVEMWRLLRPSGLLFLSVPFNL